MGKYNLFFIWILIIICNVGNISAQELKLIGGPVIGAVDESSAKIWFGYKGAEKFEIYLLEESNYQKKKNNQLDAKHKIYPDSISILNLNNEYSVTAYFRNLTSDKEYYIITEKLFHRAKTKRRAKFKTQHNTGNLRDVNFMFGSCNLIMRFPGKLFLPGLKSKIHRNMYQEEADFMVWLGDMVYYLGRDYTTKEKMFNRQMKYRQNNRKNNRLLSTQPNYAIWDDHDYGPNNANASWQLKNEAAEVFKAFWPNPYFNEEEFDGPYFTFKQEDTQFFMTDNRTYQTEIEVENPEFLGQKQLKWLTDELKKSEATFKFIAIGSQVLNPIANGESYLRFPDERKQLLDFIDKNDISGVIFLTGDRHISEVHPFERDGKYTMYDFTSSPILSAGAELVAFKERKNPNRLKGSLIGRRNYSKANITGEKGNRKLIITYHNKRGKKIREYSLSENELK